jgi:DNA-binding transcriptional LysR family regulator
VSFASAAAFVLPLAVARFRDRHPGVALEITMADPVDSIAQLRAGELDIALVNDGMSDTGPALGVVERTADIELVALFEDPMYVAMSPGHPLAEPRGHPRSLAQFAGDSWMLATSTTCPDARLFLRACHDAGFEPRVAFQNDDYGAIMGFVAAGVGVALIPDMVARGVRDDVVICDLVPAPPARPIGAVLPAGYRSAAATAMLEVLAEVGRKWVTGRLTFGPQATFSAPDALSV